MCSGVSVCSGISTNPQYSITVNADGGQVIIVLVNSRGVNVFTFSLEGDQTKFW